MHTGLYAEHIIQDLWYDNFPGVYIMHGITWKVGGEKNENFDWGGKKNKNFDGAGEIWILAERSEAEIWREGYFFYGGRIILNKGENMSLHL